MTTTTAEAQARTIYRTLVGKLTRDPELRFSTKGTASGTAGLAVNRRRRLDDGGYEEPPAEFYGLRCRKRLHLERAGPPPSGSPGADQTAAAPTRGRRRAPAAEAAPSSGPLSGEPCPIDCF
jgi:hypothetical protein